MLRAPRGVTRVRRLRGQEPTREGTETAGGVSRRAGTQRYWVIAKNAKDAKDGFGQPDLLTVDLDNAGEALPVFSFEEEADMFLWLQTSEDGREVRRPHRGSSSRSSTGPAQMSEGSCSIRCRRLGPACRSASWA